MVDEPAGRGLVGPDGEMLQAEEVVVVDGLAVLHIEAPAAKTPTLAEEDAVGTRPWSRRRR